MRRFIREVQYAYVLHHAGNDKHEWRNQVVVHRLQVGNPRETGVDWLKKKHGAQNARDHQWNSRGNGMTVNPEAKPGKENKKSRRNKMLKDEVGCSSLEGEGRL